MADLTNIRNYVLNIKNISRGNSVIQIPVSFGAYGSLKKKEYTKDSNADIANEPKLMLAPYNNIVLTNGQFGGMETDLGYVQNTKYVNIAQGLDMYYKSKIWFDNYGLGDKEAKYHHAVNESVDELPLTTDAYSQYIQENKTQRTMAWATAGINTAVGIAQVAIPHLKLMGAAGKLAGATNTLRTSADSFTLNNIPKMDILPAQHSTAQKAIYDFNQAKGAYNNISSGISTSDSFGTNNALSGINSMANQLAKEHDLKNVPDTIRTAGNNLMYDYINNNIKLYTYNTRPEKFYLDRAWQWMFRYGYDCEEYKVPDLKSRYYFNYIMTRDIKINAHIPTNHAERLKAIFNQGTTIWHYREDNTDPQIGNYTKENAEVSLNVQ